MRLILAFTQGKLSKCQTKEIEIKYGLGTALVRRWYGANLKKIESQKERESINLYFKREEFREEIRKKDIPYFSDSGFQ